MLNGVAGPPVSHAHGLGQGDPLSPLLFVIAIDPLQQILNLATSHGLFHKITGWRAIFRTSLYADDASLFMAPIKKDIENLVSVLALAT